MHLKFIFYLHTLILMLLTTMFTCLNISMASPSAQHMHMAVSIKTCAYCSNISWALRPHKCGHRNEPASKFISRWMDAA